MPCLSRIKKVFAATLFATLPALASAQAYPNRDIHIVVPFPPGGAVDILARAIGQKMGEALGKSVIIDNRAGAGGAVGSAYAAKAQPDGYTLLMGSTSSISINPALNSKLPYQPQRDFTPISLVAYVPHVLAISPNVPAKNVPEFIQYAKSQTKPPAFASAGQGSPHHLAGEIFKSSTGIDMLHVPYKGTGPGLVELMSGEVQLMSVEMVAAMPHIQANKLKVLGIAAPKRSALAPDIPTIAEAGLPGFEITSWYGVFAPAGTPPEVVTLLSKTINTALQTPEMKESLSKMGATPGGGTAQEFAAHVKREDEKWSSAAKKANVRLDM
jgi:tripartite-type tricarboxylate transporter receptor subunit TctC